MTQRQTAHIISHSHWDREWYMPYEQHHIRLIELMDTLLDVIKRDPDYDSFHLDGQTIILDDYLQVRPERKDELEQAILNGKIKIGPWYILQDEFLTSSEANLRNLLYGTMDCRKYGAVTQIGYFPDSFGNMGQAPQIMLQAGIDNAVFGRGVKPIGANNAIEKMDSFESPFSEMIWRSPDGSEVLGILFANWYHNGMEIPVDETEARQYWETKLRDVSRFASTNQLLFMNGCDHQPVQTDLTEAIRTAGKLFPDMNFIHTNFPDYLAALRKSLPEKLKVVEGELRSQQTNGWGTLVNTASSRVYIKQANQRVQTLLEQVAEPLATMAYVSGAPYPHHMLRYAWKTLMQNHPHDSICGCSVDEVHREMMARFDKSRETATYIVKESLAALARRIDTSGLSSEGRYGEYTVAFAVFNTTGWNRSGVVEIELELSKTYLESMAMAKDINAQLRAIDVRKGYVTDASGCKWSCKTQDLGVKFNYELPKDQFRKPYYSRNVKVTFEALEVPALGYKAFGWVNGKSAFGADPLSGSRSLIVGEREMANDRFHVEIGANGTVKLTDKASGTVYRDLCAYENVSDMGNEYIFVQAKGTEALTTFGLNAEVRVLEDASFRATMEIVHEWLVPKGATAELETEMLEVVPLQERVAQRSDENVTLRIVTLITLEKEGKSVRVRSTFYNHATNHRVRMLFPTDAASDVHQADSIFEVATRANISSEQWTNPSYCHPQQAFVSVGNADGGLTIANKGLAEYEILQDGRNTIAVTLLRATGELGDWGYFPTPEAQCIGETVAELEIVPFSAHGKAADSYVEAYQSRVPWPAVQTGIREGTLPAEHAFADWSGEGMALTSMKVNETRGDVMLRWFNMTDAATQLRLNSAVPDTTIYRSNVVEDRLEVILSDAADQPYLSVRPAEIATIGFSIIR